MNQKVKNILSIIATGILSFLGTNLLMGITIAMPKIIKQYQVSTDVAQLVNSGYSMLVGIFILMSPYLLKKFATPKLFKSAILLFLIGLLISGMAPNFALLLIGRLIQGIAAGISIPLMFNIIITKIPKQKRGLMIGTGTLLVTLGPALGPVYGSLVLKFLSIPWLFYLMIILVIISFLLGFKTIEPLYNLADTKIDLVSFLTLTFTLVFLTLGLSFLGSSKVPIIISIGALLISIGLGIYFFKRSAKISNPILNVEIFKNRAFLYQNIAFFLSQVTAPAVGFLLSIYMQTVGHQSGGIVSLILLPGSLLSAMISPYSGKLLDKIGAKKVISSGAMFFTIGLLLFSIGAYFYLSPLEALIFDVIFMLGMGLTTGNLQTSGISSLSNEQQSDGDAFFNSSQQYSGSVGTAMSGAILSLFQGLSGSYVLHTHTGTFVSFTSLLVLSVIADILLLLVFNHRTQKS